MDTTADDEQDNKEKEEKTDSGEQIITIDSVQHKKQIIETFKNYSL